MSASKARGTRFESLCVTYLIAQLGDDRIERRGLNGGKDRGDVAGLRHMGQRIVIECKSTARLALGVWATEAEIERGNDDAGVGVIMHKRHGKGKAEDQWVSMTLADFVSLLRGSRPDGDF